MTTLSSEEQLLLELINRARLDPAAEAARNNISLNEYILNTSNGYPITADAKQPLAGNNVLANVAENHTKAMFNSGVLARGGDTHTGAGDGTPSGRIAAAGYVQNPGYVRPENTWWAGTSAQLTEAQIQNQLNIIHNGLFKDDPAVAFGERGGHRLAMLDDNMREVGIGVGFGTVNGLNAVAATQNFGSSGTQSFLTGVVYNDTKIVNDFYDLNEGRQGVIVTVSGATTGSDVTGSGGGWSVGIPGGTYTVTYSGGGLAAAVSAIVEAGNRNAKVDLVNGNEIFSSSNTTLGANAKELHLLGVANLNGTGNASDNVIVGNKGNNLLDGGAGFDTAVFTGNRASYTVTTNADGSVTVRGAEGTDTLKNFELIQFADQSVSLNPAGSIAINDVTITEGNAGTKIATFTVTRTGGTAAFDVNFATSNGTATTADGDYVATSGTLRFGANVNTQTISVVINGDTKVEGNETFSVLLSNASNGATISDGQGVGTITNDDVAAPANTAPVITGINASIATHGSVAASSLFTAVDQQGNNTITQYAFWDSGNGGGHFTVNGVTQAAGQWIYVAANNLASIKYDGGAAVGSETLYVAAYDGQAWSANASLAAKTTDRAPDDFNGDGRSDLLWHNDNGSVAMWQMNGAQIAANQTFGSIGTTWDAAGTGDFNGDGKSDILWHNDNGSVAMWQMNGTQIAANQIFGTIGTTWNVAAVDDFNADGKDDILWFNDNGSVAMWQMNGTQIAANQSVGSVATGWHIEGTGDFNGNGTADILLRSDSGAVAMWQMNGSQIALNQTVGAIGTDWHFAGADDFNGDGKDDILWHNDNGSVAIWQMNGTQIAANQIVGTGGTGWDIVGVGDYNNDDRADILWQHDNGSVAMWQMNGMQIIANQAVGSMPTTWDLV